MTSRPATSGRHRSPGRLIVLVAAAAAVAALVFYGVVEAVAPAPARVLVTAQDCLRAFDDAACKAMVDRALALHDRTAPSFVDRATCVLMLGQAACQPVNDRGVETGRYGPPMVAILVGRSRDDLLPLYYGTEGRTAKDAPDKGRAVYFHGKRVGILATATFGGADLPEITDADGRPVSAAAVSRLRGQ